MSFNGPPPVSGDRTGLSFQELELLENSILPTARRWLNIPGLRDHALATLNYWGAA